MKSKTCGFFNKIHSILRQHDKDSQNGDVVVLYNAMPTEKIETVNYDDQNFRLEDEIDHAAGYLGFLLANICWYSPFTTDETCQMKGKCVPAPDKWRGMTSDREILEPYAMENINYVGDQSQVEKSELAVSDDLMDSELAGFCGSCTNFVSSARGAFVADAGDCRSLSDFSGNLWEFSSTKGFSFPSASFLAFNSVIYSRLLAREILSEELLGVQGTGSFDDPYVLQIKPAHKEPLKGNLGVPFTAPSGAQICFP
ncbi:hypothetical protein HS088_TW06G00525 [Tripterygium wilfordii]|uniref:Uncharacterized protein n=1 Tax=Tripterygium wilfordii TaxID=458696 RepID=A0A7J7DJE3_TRIWF|nr:hypothetical protein HS088_TW06G00525 [Tripterygium wilfordii]